MSDRFKILRSIVHKPIPKSSFPVKVDKDLYIIRLTQMMNITRLEHALNRIYVEKTPYGTNVTENTDIEIVEETPYGTNTKEIMYIKSFDEIPENSSKIDQGFFLKLLIEFSLNRKS
jgi:hypothetical protein